MFEYQQLAKSLQELGVDAPIQLFQELDERYSESTRFYHDKTHVAECLTNLQPYRSQAQHPAEIELAIWYHDAIYDTRAPDNEEQSAQLAEQALARIKLNNASITRIAEMILATKTHQVSSLDSKLMVDVDLGILGTPTQVFETYDANIRKEYHWVPMEVYIPGRAKVLESFLDRDIIYHCEQLRDLYEDQARANLRAKLQELTTRIP